MQTQRQFWRICFGQPLWPAREVSREFISLETSLEASLEMRLEEQQQNRRSGGPAPRSRRSGPGARAEALFQHNEAGCLRALANLSASFCWNSPGLSQRPVAGAHGYAAGYGQENPERASSEWPPRSRPKAFPKTPAARPAPDPPAFRSLRSHQPKPGGQARYARGSTASVAPWGAPAAVARWGSLLLPLRPWGACANFRWSARKFLPHSLEAGERFETANAQANPPVRWEPLTCRRLGLLRLLGQPARHLSAGERGKLPCQPARAASARPTTRGLLSLCASNRSALLTSNDSKRFSNLLQTQLKRLSTVAAYDNKPSSKEQFDHAAH